MYVIYVRNVNEALPLGVQLLLKEGRQFDSRNGPVLVYPTPVTTVYLNPCERVLFNPIRDANPFFHLMEALWMLAGRNDIKFVSDLVANMLNYSDDGEKQHGAYGHRWRYHFHTEEHSLDQLEVLVQLLKNKPGTRRAVLQMWDPVVDLKEHENLRDVPCNTTCYFWIDQYERLCMTVLCRSNDIVWGAYGANAVHFSVLLEYMAAAVGVPVGTMYQVSNNFHAYLNTLDPLRWDHACVYDPYDKGLVRPLPMVRNAHTFLHDVEQLLQYPQDVKPMGDNPFLSDVALPLWLAYKAWKEKEGTKRQRAERARSFLALVPPSDWRLAAYEWLNRREAKDGNDPASAAGG